MKRIPHFIDGREVQGSGGTELPVHNPASGEKTGVVVGATPDVVNAVLTAITDDANLIASVHPSMKRLDTKQYSMSTLPYHDAAVAFYKSRGMAMAN